MRHRKTPHPHKARGTRHGLPSTLLLRTETRSISLGRSHPAPLQVSTASPALKVNVILSLFSLSNLASSTRECLPAQPTCVWNVAERGELRAELGVLGCSFPPGHWDRAGGGQQSDGNRSDFNSRPRNQGTCSPVKPGIRHSPASGQRSHSAHRSPSLAPPNPRLPAAGTLPWLSSSPDPLVHRTQIT